MEADVRLIVRRLADAIAYLHEYGIVHRDLKVAFVISLTVAIGLIGDASSKPIA